MDSSKGLKLRLRRTGVDSSPMLPVPSNLRKSVGRLMLGFALECDVHGLWLVELVRAEALEAISRPVATHWET